MITTEIRKKIYNNIYAIYDLMASEIHKLLLDLPEWGKACKCTTDRLVTEKIHANFDGTTKSYTFCLECGGYISEF